MLDLAAFGPSLLGVGALSMLYLIREINPALIRAACSALCVFLAARYVWWRFEYAMPTDQTPIQQAWAWMFFTVETLSVVSSTGVLFFMSRVSHRKSSGTAPPELRNSPVDVFIATYNESYAVLERTIVGALSIDHADLRVWVLDDGARDWVREMAEELGALYVCRSKGRHAKAGNVNNGLAEALKQGRKPRFILLLDADFVAYRNILKRTLGLFAAEDVGIVQTPQHFFNPDPIQSNLLCAREWPDEQRFFFNTLLASKDAWGVAFCCGSSAVLRVDALLAAGGLATETVTEDMLTTFKFAEFGYRTIFLNEMLSMGLAPESVGAYVSQRARWCLGAMQQIYTRWSFFGSAKIGIMHRLSFLDGVLYWISNAPFKLMMISGPLIYWWTKTAVISSTAGDLFCYLAPSVICTSIYMSLYAEKRLIPVMTDVSQLLTSFAITATVVTALVKPWGHPFKVTAKGLSNDRVTVQWTLLLPFALLAVATLTGVLHNISTYSPLYGTDGYDVNVFWSVFNIVVLVLCCAVCVELPKRRNEERFMSGEAALLRLANGILVPCVVDDISLSGASLSSDFGRLRDGETGTLEFKDGFGVPFEAVRRADRWLAVRFNTGVAERRQLIAKLFTGGYANEVKHIRFSRLVAAVGKRLTT